MSPARMPPPAPDVLLAAALEYAALGWSIIPIGANKKPVRVWTERQDARPTEDQLRADFGRRGVCGLGVVLGSVSGGLACRDFDAPGVYEAWAAEHPDLARCLPTVQTARGWHVYFLAPACTPRTMADGELRAEGQYVILPPSLHPSGVVYQWHTRPSPTGLRTIDPASVFLGCGTREAGARASPVGDKVSPMGDKSDQRRAKSPERPESPERQRALRARETREAESPESPERPERPENPEMASESLPSLPSLGTPDTIRPSCLPGETKIGGAFDRLIAQHLPESEGQRNARLFNFLRAVKAMPEYASAPVESLRDPVRAWHAAALPRIATKDFDTTWADAVHAWDRIRHPKGSGPLHVAAARAWSMPEPAAACRYENPKVRRLVSLCVELQNGARAGPFYLTHAAAGELLDVDKKTAGKLLGMLIADRVLECTEPGRQGRATRYRFLCE